MKKVKTVVAILILSNLGLASTLDSKSLFIGIGIGAGTYMARKPIARGVKRTAKVTAKATVKVVTLGKK